MSVDVVEQLGNGIKNLMSDSADLDTKVRLVSLHFNLIHNFGGIKSAFLGLCKVRIWRVP